MPHFPKPWFRPSRGTWYIQLDGRQINLGPDEKAAFARYHALMAAPPEAPVKAELVAVICDRYLEWAKGQRAPETYEWYRYRLQSFLDAIPSDLTVAHFKPFHVQEWIDGMTCKSGTKRNCVRAVKRAMRWAEEQGYIDRSPIAYMKKPAGGRRDNVIPPEDHARILSFTRDRNFRDLCHFSFLTGARCAETLDLEARHLDLANHRIILPIAEEKMERVPRIIYLCEEAEEIVRRLANDHPTGKLFRNTGKRAWTPDATNCRFRFMATKLGRKVCLTDYRHSLATRLLTAGVDALTVSILLGHSDTATLSKVYSHLNHAPAFLLESVRKAVPASA